MKGPREKAMSEWNIRVEWKPEDLWIGVYWRRAGGRLDIWLCLLPCIPLHFSRTGDSHE